MSMQRIEAILLQVLEDFNGQIPSDELDEMRSMIKVGEPGIAFENLCTQIYEYDIRVAPELVINLRSIGLEMKIEPTFWERF